MTHAALSRRSVVETLLGSLVWSVVWAMLLNCLLELMQTGGDLKRLVGYSIYLHFPVFALSVGLLWVVFVLVLALSGRLWATCALTLVLVIVIGVVDHIKLDLRNEPVYPSDLDFLRDPTFLLAMAPWWEFAITALGLAIVAGCVVMAGRIPSRTFRPIRRSVTPRAWGSLLCLRLAAVVLCLFALGYVGQFNHSGNRLRQAYESEGVHWAFWFQKLNYTQNGFVPGLLYNLYSEAMVPPEGYSKSAMDRVAHRYAVAAARMNVHRTGTLDDVNVVTVLSEAFSDPGRLKGVHVEGDPIPRTRQVMATHTSGGMLAQLMGGGTANMEFETLTGQSLALFEPQLNTPYQQFVDKVANYPSIVGYLRAHGHRAIAIHPYMTSMYHRREVYRNFGIQDFIHDTTMHSARHIGHNHFISDGSAFDEVQRQISNTDQPLYVNLVTMQNHYPMAGKYDDPWPVSGVEGEVKKQLGGYARGIDYTDRALGTFLRKLSASKEKTAVIFYGDHLPAFWDDKVMDLNGKPAMLTTPFFVWTNYKTPKVQTPALSSPIYFLPLLFQQTGTPVPPYYAMLSELYRKIPAMEQGVRYDDQGKPLASQDLDSQARQLLHDYRLVQYDMSVGKRYAAARMFYPGAGSESPTAQAAGR